MNFFTLTFSCIAPMLYCHRLCCIVRYWVRKLDHMSSAESSTGRGSSNRSRQKPFNRSLGLTTSGPTLEPTVHQTMWWSLPARHSPTTTSETKSSSEQKMRSSTLAPLVGSRTFWERKLSCLNSSKRSPSPTAKSISQSTQEQLKSPAKTSSRRGPTESRRERGQHPEGALGDGSRRKPAPLAHSHGPQLPQTSAPTIS